jgi:hypothetical protein
VAEPHRRRRRRPAGRDRDGGPGLRRRPRGGERALGPARRGAGAGRRGRRGHAGPGQPRDRDAVGLLRGGGRRGGQRRCRGGRTTGRGPAHVAGRPPGAAPRREPPQHHGLRTGGPRSGRRRRPAGVRALVDRAAFARHRLVQVDDEDLLDVLVPWAPLLSTMGRGLADDPLPSSRRPPPAATPRRCWTERVGLLGRPGGLAQARPGRRPPRPRDGRPGARAPRRPARRRR